MKLSRYEEDLLAGKEGKGSQLAMEIITRLGDLYGADELIPISKAHIDGCLYAAVGEAGLDFAEKLHCLGARVKVPTSLNATSRDIDDWQEHGVDPEFAHKNTRMERAYLGMGAIPTWTCAPYQAGLIPRFGEQIAWAESNAILYANSVIGARTERYGDYTDICCAITGRVPYFGLHKTDNRAGQVLVDCSNLPVQDAADYFAVLGYLIGDLVQDKIPVIRGLPRWITGDHLKAFCAAAASSGAVAFFHMTGITPEAPDEKTAFHGKKPGEQITVTKEMISRTREQLSSAKEGEVDAVLIGCPHASAPEIMQIAAMLEDKKIREDKELWIYTSRAVNHWLTLKGVVPALKARGIKIFKDTCFINTDLRSWNLKTVMTNSAKYAHYIPARTGLKAVFASLEVCIRTMVK
ncbi:MAG: aconitase X catalytic domain-containing protein [Bacillota bacterium]